MKGDDTGREREAHGGAEGQRGIGTGTCRTDAVDSDNQVVCWVRQISQNSLACEQSQHKGHIPCLPPSRKARNKFPAQYSSDN